MVAPFYNWTLSALTLLICDLYIYQVRGLPFSRRQHPFNLVFHPLPQSKGSIDSAAADRLETILRVAEHLKGGGGADQGEDSCVAPPPLCAQWRGGLTPSRRCRSANSHPSFLWLLRDHHLQMRSEPREEMLEKMDVSAQRTLRRCFADYDCMPLPRPLDEDDKLRSLDTLKFADLKDSFREEFAILERSLRRRLARPRILGEQPPPPRGCPVSLAAPLTPHSLCRGRRGDGGDGGLPHSALHLLHLQPIGAATPFLLLWRALNQQLSPVPPPFPTGAHRGDCAHAHPAPDAGADGGGAGRPRRRGSVPRPRAEQRRAGPLSHPHTRLAVRARALGHRAGADLPVWSREVHEEAAAAARTAFEEGAIADAEETGHYRASLERKLGSWDQVGRVEGCLTRFWLLLTP